MVGPIAKKDHSTSLFIRWSLFRSFILILAILYLVFGHEVKAEGEVKEIQGTSRIMALSDVCLDLVRPGMNFARFVGSIHASQSAHRSSKTGIGRLSSLFVRLDLNIDGILDSLELSVVDGPLKSCGRSADLAMASQGISDIL